MLNRRFMVRLALACCLGVVLADGLHSQESPFLVERLSSSHWRIRVENAPPRIYSPDSTVPYSRVAMPGYLFTREEGLPELPFTRFPFALPSGGTLEYSVAVSASERVEAALTPFVRLTSTPRVADAANRSSDSFVRKSSERQSPGYRESAIEVVPVRYDPRSGQLTWVRSMTIDVFLRGGAFPAVPGTAKSRTGFPDLAVNAADAVLLIEPRHAGGQATTPWFMPDEPMAKIRLRDDGVYRISKPDLDAAGVPLSGVDPRSFRIYHRGTEQPIEVFGEEDGRFDDGDFIEFYGRRRAGTDGEWLDWFEEDNVYFLRWNGAPGLRLGREDAAPRQHPALSAIPTAIHLEEDHVYHFGDHDESDANVTERVFGEGWVWRYLQKKDSLTIPFHIDAIRQGGQDLTFRVKGSSRDSSRIRILVNGREVTDFRQHGYALTAATVPIPDDVLVQGENTLAFINVGIVDCPPTNPTCTIERYYVDWASIRHLLPVAAAKDAAVIDPSYRIDSSAAPARMLATIPGFRSPSIKGINLDAWTSLTGISVTFDAGVYTAAASLMSSDAYVLYSDSAVTKVRSIVPVTIPDFAGLSANTDYLLVTHASFRAAAERLARYRNQKDGFACVVAEVDDIYNAFNAGLKNPSAIKAFVRQAYDISTEKKPRFLTLLGDASWDARRLREDATKIDFVPTFGNPVSDNYYAAFAGDSIDVTPMLNVGRIPVETESSANDVIDKIMEYEQVPAQRWHNRMLYVVGGKSTIERDWYLLPPVLEQIAKYASPFCLESDLVLKKSLELVSYDDLDTIIAKANRGALWFYFTGHGGTRIIDVGVERPDVFSLKGRYPFFLTMSCNTAHYAEPFETGLNERFTIARDNGAIATYGTSGLGEVRVDAVLSEGLHEGMLNRSFRTFGEISTFAKSRLITLYGTRDIIARNTVNQYALLGDPATHIPLAQTPELLITSSDIATSPEIVNEQQETAIMATLHNAGTCLVDSVDVRMQILQGGAVVRTVEERIPAFLRDTVLRWTHTFAEPANVTIALAIDPHDYIMEASELNNTAAISRNVLPGSLTPIFPLDNAVLAAPASGSLEFVLANPSNVPPDDEEPVIEWECSASPDFITAVSRKVLSVGMVFTRFDFQTAGFPPGIIQYWRARMRTKAGPDLWSRVRSFMLESGSSVNETWRQTDSAQFIQGTGQYVVISPSGEITLGERSIELNALSAAANQIEIRTAALRINGVDVSQHKRGFNVAVVDGTTGLVDTVAVFDTYLGTAEAAEMTTFLDAVAEDKYLLAAVFDDANGYFPPNAPGSNITPELREAMRRFGARYVDSIGFRDSYAFIGTKGNPAVADEMHSIYGLVRADLRFTGLAAVGTIRSPVIGPANAWDYVEWDGTLPTGNTQVKLNVRPAGRDTILIATQALAPRSPVDLSSIPAARYPHLHIEAVLIDTTVTSSPVIGDWLVRYTSVFPENGINNQVVRAERDSVPEGAPLQVTVAVYNAGRKDAQPVRVVLSVPFEDGRREASSTIPVLGHGKDVHETVQLSVPTGGLRGDVPFEVSINPSGSDTQYYFGNDVYSRRVRILRDGARPDLSVRFDGIPIVDNDYVSPRPVISIRLRDESPLPVTDTSSVQIFLDGRRIWLTDNPLVRYSAPPTGSEKVDIEFTPALQSGVHSLSVSGKDASGNLVDSIPYQVRFLVSAENRIDRIVPFPSPTTGPMDFTFRILGDRIPNRAVVKIYTLAGRLIREVVVEEGDLHIGFNRISWDGRDGDTAELANGTYFFKLVTMLGGEQLEYVGRFAVLK